MLHTAFNLIKYEETRLQYALYLFGISLQRDFENFNSSVSFNDTSTTDQHFYF